MAFRVDDIIVSEKNVMLLSDGKQYVADIEKEQEIVNSFNRSRDKNPWNLKTEDGKILNNLFCIDDFSVRTQVITGSSGASTNYKSSHETYFMPNAESYVGNCQFYDNAYSISEKTDKNFTSTYNTTSGKGIGKYESDSSFIRYDGLSTYDNMVDYYITPNTAFAKNDGVQYITEYPINSFYSDFGDNEDRESPTIYGDSCPVKYYLDESYSVNSTNRSGNTKSDFSYLRTYYDIGNTGNSIYLVYRNDLNGSSVISSNGGTYIDTHKIANNDYIISGCASKISYMSNITTISNSISGITYASDPYSDFFQYSAMSGVNGFSFIKQPKRLTFALFFKKNTSSVSQAVTSTTITYLPKNGLDRSSYSKTISEDISESCVIELENSVIIATASNGILNAVDIGYCSESGTTTIEHAPFRYAMVGRPDDCGKKVLDGNSEYKNFSITYDGYGIVGATATVSENGTNSTVALLSTSSSSTTGDAEYDVGILFMPLGNPMYETTVTVENHYSTTETLSSVPSSYEVEGKTIWTYVLSSVTMRELTGTTETSSFSPSSNSIAQNSSILFDYSPMKLGEDIKLGNYAFVQFNGYGLSKIHSDEIYGNELFAKTTTTGPMNRAEMISVGSVCKGVHFNSMSYGESEKNKYSEVLDFIGTSHGGNVVYGKPAMVATFKDSADKYFNTFTTFPFTRGRSAITEPTFSSKSATACVEQSPVSSNRFILDEPVKKSLGVSVRTFGVDNINHDSSVALVRWNSEDGKFHTESDYSLDTTSVSGLHLQYCGICTELYVVGKNVTSDAGGSNYTSTIYEYPHSCYGDLKTAGTGLSIFDGELSSSMTAGDIMVLNGYLIVKNYAVRNNPTDINSQTITEKVRESGKTYGHDTGSFKSGGYVITNFFAGGEANVHKLYDSELISSSKTKSKTNSMSETVYDYSYLWHIRPSNPIEFYPESKSGVEWSPYYATKYVDFIRYHGGYYYIALRNSNKTVGYDIIETKDLFTEENAVKLTNGRYVSDIRFFDDNVAVEYTDIADATVKNIMWFKQGKSSSKTYSIAYCNTTSFETTEVSAINRASLTTTYNETDRDTRASFDNVEIVHSLNRFNSVVNHKSNIFSIKVSDLGLDSSPYLTESQKKKIRTWFKNRISTIANSVKPANTQLFDVFVD